MLRPPISNGPVRSMVRATIFRWPYLEVEKGFRESDRLKIEEIEPKTVRWFDEIDESNPPTSNNTLLSGKTFQALFCRQKLLVTIFWCRTDLSFSSPRNGQDCLEHQHGCMSTIFVNLRVTNILVVNLHDDTYGRSRFIHIFLKYRFIHIHFFTFETSE